MNFVRPPFFLKWIYPHVTYRKSARERTIYLTFDDGPIPEVTPWVLDTLAQHGAKATFFCVGENIDKHPAIFERLKTEGHTVGNHTYHHLKGWDTAYSLYLKDIAQCNKLTRSRLFRPPFLRATRRQLQALRKDFEVVFFDVISYDFDARVSANQCFKNVVDNVRNGSIVVFHDNIKAFDTLKHSLPSILDELRARGYSFAALS